MDMSCILSENRRMKKTDNPADPFKKALAEATRALADERELNVTYSADPSGVAGDTMRLPQVSRRMTRDEIVQARGTADALAMKLRHHDDTTHARYAPAGPMARELYEAMETARCEALGARDMAAATTITPRPGGTPADPADLPPGTTITITDPQNLPPELFRALMDYAAR